MSTINLSEWLDNRGVFKDVKFGEVELQIVSLSKDLIQNLKMMPTHKDMISFVADAGLSHHRMRMVDDEELEKELPVIWGLSQFKDVKGEIVDSICELSDIAEILSDKKDEEEKAELAKLEAEEAEEAEEDADKFLSGDGEMPLHEDMGKIEADMNAHNNINP